MGDVMGEKVIGILGGMGPLATVELFRRIIINTPAKRDQEHLKIIIYNNPKIPDRTEYLIGKGESPLPELIRSAKQLEKCGADFIVMPCNTAHFFLKEIEKELRISILSMIDAAADRAKKLKLGKVGILATTGTVKAGIYQKALEKRGLLPILPSEEEQEILMKGIYEGVKAGNFELGRKLILEVAKYLERKCDGIIAGCTEVSVVINQKDLKVKFIDAMDALAKRAVEFAKE